VFVSDAEAPGNVAVWQTTFGSLTPAPRETMAKIKGRHGYRFIKEFGGAIRRETVSKAARFLEGRHLLKGRVLDYGCGFGFDADHFGWEAFDPHYRQNRPEGVFDTVICNHVANMLTRKSRQELFQTLRDLLAPGGKAYIAVSRKIPKEGKMALRKRIQNYVVLTLPSLFRDDELEIYCLEKESAFDDVTQEIEGRL
jgi:SAM-dependent methyltransferase